MGALLLADTLQAPTDIDWFALSPLLILLGGAMVLLVLAALTPQWPKRGYALFTVAIGVGGCLAAVALVLFHVQSFSCE